MTNPNTIEITGQKTIIKLCHFGADNGMEGRSFTEIVEKLLSEYQAAAAEADRLKSEPTDKEINVALEAFHRNFRDDPAQDMRFAIKALMKEKEQNHDC